MSDFLARWSKRARAARPRVRDDAGSLDAPIPPAADSVEGSDAPKPPDLPDVEELGAESDYRPFLQRTVAPALRRLALRRLWRSDPVLANLDGLNDYDEDFAALHKTGADAIAAAVRAGRRYARDPAAPPGADPAAAAEPADPAPAAPQDGVEAVDATADAPDAPEKPA